MTDVTAAEHHSSELNDQVVAVGVDGSPEALAAARYAVRAADLRGLNLLMVHAYELPPLDVPMDEGILDACHQAARNLMADVAAQLVIPRQMRIDTVVQPDSPVVLLDDISRTVPLLVVGQDHLGWGERLTFGAVASHVGQKAQCPVVVVPGGWQAPRTVERHPIVVALDEDTPRDAVLTAAFQEAEFLRTGARGAPRVALPQGWPERRLRPRRQAWWSSLPAGSRITQMCRYRPRWCPVTRTPTSSSGPASLLCWCWVDGSGTDGVTGLTPFFAPWSNRRTAH